MSTTNNKQIIQRRIEEIWHKGSMAAIDELIARDYVSNGQQIGREGFRQFVTAVRAAFPDIRFTVEDMFSEGDKVAVRYTGRGTHQGEFAGIPASGQQVEFMGNDIFRVADEQIAEEWLMYDQLGLLQQIGAIPTTG